MLPKPRSWKSNRSRLLLLYQVGELGALVSVPLYWNYQKKKIEIFRFLGSSFSSSSRSLPGSHGELKRKENYISRDPPTAGSWYERKLSVLSRFFFHLAQLFHVASTLSVYAPLPSFFPVHFGTAAQPLRFVSSVTENLYRMCPLCRSDDDFPRFSMRSHNPKTRRRPRHSPCPAVVTTETRRAHVGSLARKKQKKKKHGHERSVDNARTHSLNNACLSYTEYKLVVHARACTAAVGETTSLESAADRRCTGMHTCTWA